MPNLTCVRATDLSGDNLLSVQKQYGFDYLYQLKYFILLLRSK